MWLSKEKHMISFIITKKKSMCVFFDNYMTIRSYYNLQLLSIVFWKEGETRKLLNVNVKNCLIQIPDDEGGVTVVRFNIF